MSTLRRFRFGAVASGFLLATAAAWGALLGVTPGVPTTTFSLPGTTSYNATTDVFTVSALPVAEAFGSPIGTKAIASPKGLTITIHVDSTGALAGGVAGNDLTLTGSIDTNGDSIYEYSGVLLTGEILAFGSQNVSTTDMYDFRFQVTGGALAPLYANKDIGVRLTSENSTFTGSFATSFSGRAKGTIGPINPLGRIGDLVWQDDDHDGIQDAGEPGIAGVTVYLKDLSDNILKTATTDANGNYLFSGLPAGTYVVEVVPPSGLTASPTDQGADDAVDSDPSPITVVLGPGEQNLTIDWGFYPPCTGMIGDIVWNDLDRDGIQDAGEQGINGVTVQLLDASNTVIATQVTHTEGVQLGYYEFTGLCGGTYYVQVDQSTLPPGFVASPTEAGSDTGIDSNPQHTQVVLVGDNDSNPTIDFGYNTPCSGEIGNFVWDDLDRDGIQDAGEPGLVGITVNLLDAATNAVLQTTTTAINGAYLFSGLCAGDYKVQVDLTTLPPDYVASPTLQGGDTGVDSNVNGGTVNLPTDSSSDLTIDFGYNSPCSGEIGNFLWNDLDRDGIQDAGEPGIDGVTVYLRDPVTNAILQTDTTGPNGEYMFNGLCAGDYKVEVDLTTLPPDFVASPTLQGGDTGLDSNVNGGTVNLPTDSSSDLTIDFGYNAPCAGTIGDYVWNDADQDGVQDTGEAGIDNVTVNLYGPGHVLLQTDITSGGGGYLFTGLCGGDYTVEVDPTTLPAGYIWLPSPSFQGGDAALDSNDIPAPVTLPTDWWNDLTIDFGYFTQLADIEIVKYTNGEDADTPTGPSIAVGGTVTWTYVVTNTGNVPLTGVTVTDNMGVTVSCPQTTLAVAETMTCTAIGIAVAGQYANIGTATGNPPSGPPVTDENPSHYIGFVPVPPDITIDKTASPTSAAPGQAITYTYVVTNTGGVPLTDITITDDNGTPANAADDFIAGTITSPDMLLPGESRTFTKTVTPSLANPPVSNALLGGLNNYSLFALNGGTMSINSATSITGNVGISSGVDTLAAQKVDAFTGTAYVHTTAYADFAATYASATFAPSGGVIHDATGDALLDQANTDAANLKTYLNGLFAAGPVTSINGSVNQTLTAAGTYNLYDVTWAYDTNTLTLNGGPNDWFIFRSTTTGNTWADSQVILNGVDPNHVLFYFTGANALDFTVNKATTAFQGTIFAPDGEVLYHNPATFNGRIIAKNVTVHSDFNITQPPYTPPTLTNTATVTVTVAGTPLTKTDTATVTFDK